MIKKRHSMTAKPPRRRLLKATSLLAVLLGAVFCFLVITIGFWFNIAWEIPVGGVRVVSERTRDILAETQGRIRITCYMDRRSAAARPLTRLLRGLAAAARSVAGAEIDLEYVDPRWDMTLAAQLAGRGVPENSLEFEYQRRKIVIPLDEFLAGDGAGGFRGERICASAIARLALPQRESKIYWTQGHGEARFDDYDEFRGFSDIAHDLKRDGFRVEALTLAGLREIPSDGSVLVMAGARRELTEAELRVVERYLDRGGSLLYLAAPGSASGCEKLLKSWGIEITDYVAVSDRTLTGNDMIVSAFSDHPVTRNLKNSSVVFGLAACLKVTDMSGAESSVDLTRSKKLVQSDKRAWGELHPEIFPRRFDPSVDLAGPVTVAAVAERGGAVSRDVAYKPTRICVFGDVDFVMNRALASRSHANRDLFLNAVGWLAGISEGGSSSIGGDATLTTGFDRDAWIVAMVWSVLAVPLAALVLFRLLTLGRGR